jgi:predicted SAM-dependent methyltransferase
MKLLHLGAGDVRPSDPWVNMDTYGYPAHNAVIWDMNRHPWPFADGEFDGIAAQHVFEHFDAHQLQLIVGECYRVLKSGGVLRVGVPDASRFREVYTRDNRDNAVELFGEPLRHPGYETFTGWALFLYSAHFQVFTEDAMWCTLVNREYPPRTVGFSPANVVRAEYQKSTRPKHYCGDVVAYLDNRPKFTLYMEAFK